jgi:glycosyltransferase involved in cell wall biosynthesis
LRRFWRTDRPDVVHVATEGPLGWAAVRTARRLGIPVGSSFHTNFHTYGRHYGYGALHRLALRYLRFVHNRTGRTVVPSKTIAERLEGDGFRNLEIMGRGVDPGLFSPDRRDPGLRAEWGVEPDAPVALYVSRIAAEKNVPLAIEAFLAMRRERPDMKLVLVGDGPARAGIEAKHPEFLFAGLRRGEDLARHYASGDVFLFGSVTETFGNVVTEALASGLVVLAYRYAAAAQHIVPGENGITVPLGDEAAFLAAAADVAKRTEDWPPIRRAARNTALELTWDAVIARFEAILRSLAETGTHERRAGT